LSTERLSPLAVVAVVLADLAVTLAVAGPLLANLALLSPLAGFQLFALGGLLGLPALVLGAFALRATRDGRPGRRLAWLAVALGSLVLAVLLSGALAGRGLPRINDITTDPDDPPVFVAAVDEPANRGRDLAYPAGFAALQREAYADLAPIRLDAPPVDAFERARRAAQALGWEITLSDPGRGVLEARAVSRVFRFVDDIAVRVRPADGGSLVDVRSKSRDGQGDLGANANRIRAFAAELAETAGGR
jgi:uncharacterized protein (DUF1499 family)